MAPTFQTSLIVPSGMARTDWSSTQGGIQERQEEGHVTSSTVAGLVQTPPAFSPVIMLRSGGNTPRGLLTA